MALNQHRFRKKHSTVSAIREVVDVFQAVQNVCHGARPFVLAATLDVRNASNWARWADILDALRAFRVPTYLLWVFEDYLWDRRITYDIADGTKTREVTTGVVQGSILGPDFWNVVYDSLLRTEMPEGCSLVGYADDIIVVIVTTEQVIHRIDSWTTEHGMQLTLTKTKLIQLTRKRIETLIPITVGNESIRTRRASLWIPK